MTRTWWLAESTPVWRKASCTRARTGATSLATLSPLSAFTATTTKVVRPSLLMNVESPVLRNEATVPSHGWRENLARRLSSSSAPGPLSTGAGACRVTAKKSLSGRANRVRSRMSAAPASVGSRVPPRTLSTCTTWGDFSAAT